MSIPMDKYRFVESVNRETGVKTIRAFSTYAGKVVCGVARCNPEDQYDSTKGRMLAAARCNAKIAEKRYARAQTKADEANEAVSKAMNHRFDMDCYAKDSYDALTLAKADLNSVLSKM